MYEAWTVLKSRVMQTVADMKEDLFFDARIILSWAVANRPNNADERKAVVFVAASALNDALDLNGLRVIPPDNAKKRRDAYVHVHTSINDCFEALRAYEAWCGATHDVVR